MYWGHNNSLYMTYVPFLAETARPLYRGSQPTGREAQREVRPRSTSNELSEIVGYCNMADYSSNTICDLPTVKRLIAPDMNMIACFTCEEYIVEFKSRKFR